LKPTLDNMLIYTKAQEKALERMQAAYAKALCGGAPAVLRINHDADDGIVVTPIAYEDMFTYPEPADAPDLSKL